MGCNVCAMYYWRTKADALPFNALAIVWLQRSGLLRGNQLHSGVLNAHLACHAAFFRLRWHLTLTALSQILRTAGFVV